MTWKTNLVHTVELHSCLPVESKLNRKQTASFKLIRCIHSLSQTLSTPEVFHLLYIVMSNYPSIFYYTHLHMDSPYVYVQFLHYADC